MNRPSRSFLAVLVASLALVGIVFAAVAVPGLRARVFGPANPAVGPGSEESEPDTYTVDITDYNRPADVFPMLVDDRIEDKTPPFLPDLVDRRPMEGWRINSSAAVIRLDCPLIRPDVEPELAVLHPSYAAAVAGKSGVIPSVNAIDGKAKRFDDGLYAAIDRAYFVGQGERLKSLVAMFRTLHDRVPKDGPAAEYLAAGLELAGEKVAESSSAAVKSQVSEFLADEVQSKPIGVYTWDDTLSRVFRTLRFFSRPISDPKAARGLADALKADPALLGEYRTALAFYAKLSNPLVGKSPADLIDGPDVDLARVRVSLFPPSSSREADLFIKLFPLVLPADVDLMKELIAKIRSGEVDLKPRKDGGWYDYQVFALESLLLPERGEEKAKLLLTKAYKTRMLQAFQALLTKRRETHVRQLEVKSAAEAAPRPLSRIDPRLRLEPLPTYYLRTARSYAFLANFLESAVGPATLKEIRGLTEKGPREATLADELPAIRDLFYGLFFLSAEDIGMEPKLLDGEPVDRAKCEKAAEKFLESWKTDPDLSADTRVAVPIFFDGNRRVTRLWMTIGVRLTQLDVRYARGPKVRPVDSSDEWTDAKASQLGQSEYLIPVDEFAEVELEGSRVLTRDEIRALCDRMKTKDAILKALRK